MAAYPPDPPDWEVLIALAHRDGRAAVCRDPDESLWLAWNLDDLSDTGGWDDELPDDDEEWDPRWEFGFELQGYEIAGLGTAVDDIVALGGRMPPGAERVEVFDEWGGPIPATVGSGVWLAVTDTRAGDEQAVARVLVLELAECGRRSAPSCLGAPPWSAEDERQPMVTLATLR
jgi:hypothetical protein